MRTSTSVRFPFSRLRHQADLTRLSRQGMANRRPRAGYHHLGGISRRDRAHSQSETALTGLETRRDINNKTTRPEVASKGEGSTLIGDESVERESKVFGRHRTIQFEWCRVCVTRGRVDLIAINPQSNNVRNRNSDPSGSRQG